MALTPKTISQHVDRVVRTDFFFDKETAPGRWTGGDDSFSLAVVFIKKSEAAKKRRASPDLKYRNYNGPLEREPEKILEYLINLPNDNGNIHDFFQTSMRVYQPFGLPHYLLEQKVVIERSPPLAESLGHLLHGATAISIGTLLGTGLSSDPTVAFYAVPGGVIVMGAAIGISKGLEKGLTKLIDSTIARIFPSISRVSKPKAPPKKAKAKAKAKAKKA
jgi:hypothetical protein